MDDLTINILSEDYLSDDSYVKLELNNIPKIIGKFIISKEFLLPHSIEDLEMIRFIFADDKKGIIELSNHIIEYGNYLQNRNIKNKNLQELIIKGYLDEIYDILYGMNLVNKEEDKVYRK